MKYPAGLGRSRYAIPATGDPVRTGKVGGCTGTRPFAIGRAFSSVVNRKKLALWENVISVLASPSPSKTFSSQTGGGSTGRRSAEAGARISQGNRVGCEFVTTYTLLQNHMHGHVRAAGSLSLLYSQRSSPLRAVKSTYPRKSGAGHPS